MMKNFLNNRFVLIFCVVLILNIVQLSPSFAQESVYTSHTQLSIIPEYTTLVKDIHFRVALHVQMDPGWHIYWINPGDSGLAPSLNWKHPFYLKDLSQRALQWPYPERIISPPLVSYGYSAETTLFSTLHLSEEFPDKDKALLSLDVQWLACKVECIPGEAQLSIDLPISSQLKKNERFKKQAVPFLSKLPIRNSLFDYRAKILRNKIILEIQPNKENTPIIEDLYFFPLKTTLINHASNQDFNVKNKSYSLSIPLSDIFSPATEQQLEGVLLVNFQKAHENKPLAIWIKSPLEFLGGEAQNQKILGQRVQLNFWVSIIFAFIGGMILNLLPCVLPVLSIKVLSLIEQTHQNRKNIWLQGVMFTLGILVMYWILAALLIFLKGLGFQIGWGFQLQNPFMLVLLSGLFFCLVLYLWGIIEFKQNFMAIGGHFQNKDNYSQSFFYGLLTTLCATPCTAPFMGIAIGFALVQPPLVAFLIFTSMGLGMAFPYLLLSRFPQWLSFLPKPGPWMMHIKIFFGFMLLATIFWLSWILGLQKGVQAVVSLNYFLLLLGLGIWIISVSNLKNMSKKKAAIFRPLAWMIILFAMIIGFKIPSFASQNRIKKLSEKSTQNIAWQPYSEELLFQSLENGKRVFIDLPQAPLPSSTGSSTGAIE